MKKWIIAALCLALCLSFCLPAAAAEDLLKPRQKLHTHHYESVKPDTLSQTLAYMAEGMTFPENIPYFPDSASLHETEDLAWFVLAQLAAGADRDALAAHDAVTNLLAAQKEDGSFGTAYETAICLFALRSVAPGKFSAEKAVNALLAMQQENGSFGDAKTNSFVLSALSAQTVQKPVADAVAKLCDGVQLPTAAEDLAWFVMGLTDVTSSRTEEFVAAFVKAQQEDGSFGSKEADTAALFAVNAYESGNSVFVRLAEKGSLQIYELSDFLPLLITWGVLTVGAVVFWLCILLRKKKGN